MEGSKEGYEIPSRNQGLQVDIQYKHSNDLEIKGYTYLDFVGRMDSRKSTSGYIFFLANGAISWSSKNQIIVTSSTVEVEFIGCCEATSQAKWLKNFISSLKVVNSIERPLKIFCDNSAAAFFSKNNKSGSRSNHIFKFLVGLKYVFESY